MSWESSHERGVKRDNREKITSLPFITIGLRGRLRFFVIEPGILGKMAVSNMLDKELS